MAEKTIKPEGLSKPSSKKTIEKKAFSKPSSKKKILIVDDEEDIRNLFKEQLEDGGYEVEAVESGKACLQQLRQKTYDLVLMDLFMPDISGRETFEHILNNKNWKSTKVAFLTVADLGEKGKEELAYMEAVDYMNKPIDGEELVARVKKILGD
jgi:two-component system, OmpR family, alkaline phosphatase synthesis response regulator PhoP